MFSASTITTERLTLDPLVAGDAEVMVDVLADERMHTFTGGRPLSLDELRARYRRLEIGRSPDGEAAWLNWIVRLRDGRRPVGVMQATVAADGSVADVAWEVGFAAQGKGIASEAATAVVAWLIEQDVQTVRALIHPDHAASAAVASRAGLAATDESVDGEIVWHRSMP